MLLWEPKGCVCGATKLRSTPSGTLGNDSRSEKAERYKIRLFDKIRFFGFFWYIFLSGEFCRCTWKRRLFTEISAFTLTHSTTERENDTFTPTYDELIIRWRFGRHIHSWSYTSKSNGISTHGTSLQNEMKLKFCRDRGDISTHKKWLLVEILSLLYCTYRQHDVVNSISEQNRIRDSPRTAAALLYAPTARCRRVRARRARRRAPSAVWWRPTRNQHKHAHFCKIRSILETQRLNTILETRLNSSCAYKYMISAHYAHPALRKGEHICAVVLKSR